MPYSEAPKVIKILADNYAIIYKHDNDIEAIPNKYLYKGIEYDIRSMVLELAS